MNDKYFYYDANQKSGLDHHTSNLRRFFSEASLLNRIAIIPIFHLAGWHNQGRDIKNHLDRYYDFSQINIEGKPLKVILSSEISIPESPDKTLLITENQIISDEQNQQFDFIIRNIKSCLWRPVFKKNYGRNSPPITILVNKKILKAATDAGKILKNYHAIHVRRDEKLNYPLMNYFTSPKAIIRKLAKAIPSGDHHQPPFLAKNRYFLRFLIGAGGRYQSVLSSNNPPSKPILYLMSDERKPGFFDELEKHYQLKRWFDLEPVKAAVAEFADDNYFLYRIEKSIFENADIKIITRRGNSDIKLYPDFVFNVNGFFNKFIRQDISKFKLLLFFYNIKPIKLVFKKIFRRGEKDE